ncbi:MAG: hypothetical protein A4S15_09595 [Candidatus Raskinella chloraquaticus]|uniref:Uncharacterized protein n=1 Tax=Candidatus Raskinella chloraquaticus TaxID=1951219 RepID=A0A1W9HXA7_9HYPH|nr:MAG: hypothetical protein A4S15_09595 [Proteobacteria bacterium SG_bin8]
MVHGMTLPLEQHMQAPITKAAAFMRNRFHPLTQCGIILSNSFVSHRHPARADGFTRPPFAHPVVRHKMHDSFSLADKPVQSAQA